ncbi:hypothetical protein [Vibrio bathopelagicus]|uniref:hypothetical protein n=1 Tax=Vibrio bathopelagicus TaxID=2777577 RepID=UPI001CF1D3AB|nr:hypothetical protein [Vibrio bathopelagicus]
MSGDLLLIAIRSSIGWFKGVMAEYLELDMLTLEAISKESGFPIEREVYLALRTESIEQGRLF